MQVISPPWELHCLPCEKHVKPYSCNNDKSEFSRSQVSWRQIAWKCSFCCLAISKKATKASNLALMLWVFKLSICDQPFEISVRMREVDNQTNPLSVSFSIYPYPIQQGLLNMELPWGQYNQVPDGIGYSYPTCEFSEILNDFVWLLQHVSHDCTLAIRDHAGPPRSTGWHLGGMPCKH